MNRTNDQTVAHQAADVVDNVADSVRAAANNVGAGVQHAAQAVRDAGCRAVNSVEDTCQQAGERARDSVKQGLSLARACEGSFERYVRENPKSSLLIAAAVGGALVAWFNRR